MRLQPANPNYRAAVRSNFGRQAVMRMLGGRLSHVSPGRVSIDLPIEKRFTQQAGWVHAGILATIVDSAGGYAAYTLMPADSDVLTVEFKLNFLAPARGTRIRGEGRVVRAGHRLTVCELRVEAVSGRHRELCAVGTQTLYCVRPEAASVAVRRTSRSRSRSA